MTYVAAAMPLIVLREAIAIAANRRREQIAELLQDRRYLTIDALSNKLGVSSSSVRRDLKVLEEKGLVQLLYGGVVMRKSPLQPYCEREFKYAEEKRAIGQRAAQMVKEGDVVIIDAGSTASQVAYALSRRKDLIDVTVITPAINVARFFLDRPSIRVLLSGGELTRENEGMIGRIAEEFFSHVHAGAVFLSSVGITPEAGAMYADHERAALRGAMVKCARQVVFIADHSKFGRIAPASGFPIRDIHTLITDENASNSALSALEAFRSRGIAVDVVPIARP